MSVAHARSAVLQRMAAAAAAAAASGCGRHDRPVQLVAVSKTQPVSIVRELFDAGQRHFGENYVAELVEKSAQLPDEIAWHFIGHLQKNKVKKLLSCRNLTMIETIDSEALVELVQRVLTGSDRTISVLIQVKTSDEDSKSGCAPQDVASLAQHIVRNCPNLSFAGLMTIGEADDTDCFAMLRQLRRTVAERVGVAEHDLELSMGMSGDFEKAIEQGSTSVRIGSALFGARPAKPS